MHYVEARLSELKKNLREWEVACRSGRLEIDDYLIATPSMIRQIVMTVRSSIPTISLKPGQVQSLINATCQTSAGIRPAFFSGGQGLRHTLVGGWSGKVAAEDFQGPAAYSRSPHRR